MTKFLVEAIREKVEPTNFLICEVPPVLQIEEMNQKNTEFNKLIHEKYDGCFTVLNLNHMYRRLSNMQSFFYDNIHFNRKGLAVLKNTLLSQLLRISSGVSTKHCTSYNGKPMRTNQYIKKIAYTLLNPNINITKRQRLLQN